MSRTLLSICLSAAAWAQKPTIKYTAPVGEDERPVMTTITVVAQGSDYALKLDFDKPPWGERCGTRCANATVFIDADNNLNTGLKLVNLKAAERGADLAITIFGVKLFKAGVQTPTLKIKVLQYSEDAKAVEEGHLLAEASPLPL
jgi:hypothetical protein